jgi:beta-fructofuranosidase
MQYLNRWVGFLAALAWCGNSAAETTNSSATLSDKTLVVWAAPANLTQRGGSALTIDDDDSHFDAIVFGEVLPQRWMAGSDFYNRTLMQQESWPAEESNGAKYVQIAIVYEGRNITIYRDGEKYADYKMSNPPQQFGPHPVVLFGQRHLTVSDAKQSFAGRIRDARIYNRPLAQATVAGLHPGEVSKELMPWAWWSFGDEGLREKTGRFTEIKLIGDVRIENGCLVLAGNGATVINFCSETNASLIQVPRAWSANGPVPDAVLRSTRMLRERLLADPYRPGYHFCLPEDMGIPGDPNGAFFANGRYHLMYLYSRTSSGFCWGHVSSLDLLHWRHHPDAIGPGMGDEGCFSGGAFVDSDGIAYLSYWMLWGAKGIGLASSHGPDFDNWTKLAGNPVIRSTEWGVTEAKDPQGRTIFYGSADPSNIWRHNGHYYILTGNLLVLNKIGRAPTAPVEEQGDRLYLFESDDLKAWRYLHVFYERKPQWTDRSEDNMCPSFLPLPSRADGGAPSQKHLLLFIAHNRGCQYYVGDYRNDRFYPDNHGRMSWVDNTYFAPEALLDGQGRQIMWAWLTDNPPDEKRKGWSGVYGLPRSLWLGEDGTLRMAPVRELEKLRVREQTAEKVELADGKSQTIEVVSGDCCELLLEIDGEVPKRCGVKVRASPGGEEQTIICCDSETKELVFDATHSGEFGRKVVERAPFELKRGEPLRLRVFVDKSVIEVFANERQAIGRRVYPARKDSTGVFLFALGGAAKFDRVKTWDLAPANPY